VWVEVVLDGHIEKDPDMAIGHFVEDLTPSFARADQPAEAELSELVTGTRLARANDRGQVTDAELPTFDQSIEDSKTDWVTEVFEALGVVVGRLLI
jgi:hypothetical protein